MRGTTRPIATGEDDRGARLTTVDYGDGTMIVLRLTRIVHHESSQGWCASRDR